MASELLGVKELQAKLRKMADPKDQAKALRASVSAPQHKTAKVARANISKISPGKRQDHRTYLGRIVSAGFASRNVIVRTALNRAKTAAWSKLGVRKEAYYAINFFELGTAKLPRQPWLVPAFEQRRSGALSDMAASLKKSVLKYTRRSA